MFKKEYLAGLDAGTYVYEIATTKGNAVAVTLTVLDSTPSVTPNTADFEKGTPSDVVIDIDFKGYTVDVVYLNGEMIDNVNYQVNDSTTKMTLKRGYLLELAAGEHTFKLLSSSGVTVEFTVTITDSRPVFESDTASYDKTSADGLTVKLDVKGKTVSEVKLNGTLLDADKYVVDGGDLTAAKAVFDSLNAGIYTLSVTTDCGTASVTLTVLDVQPTASVDTAEASAGSDLVITLDTKGRDIISVVVGDFALTTADYTYENGKLTVGKALISELAVGEKTVVITTTGGKVEVTFTVTATNPTPAPAPGGDTAKNGCNCNGSVAAASLPLTVLLLAGCWFLLLRRRATK